jgi:hypothetical protein
MTTLLVWSFSQKQLDLQDESLPTFIPAGLYIQCNYQKVKSMIEVAFWNPLGVYTVFLREENGSVVMYWQSIDDMKTGERHRWRKPNSVKMDLFLIVQY